MRLRGGGDQILLAGLSANIVVRMGKQGMGVRLVEPDTVAHTDEVSSGRSPSGNLGFRNPATVDLAQCEFAAIRQSKRQFGNVGDGRKSRRVSFYLRE